MNAEEIAKLREFYKMLEKEFPTKGMSIFNPYRKMNTFKWYGAEWADSELPHILTDKEINEHYPVENTDRDKTTRDIINTAKRIGAKWLRSQQTESNPTPNQIT